MGSMKRPEVKEERFMHRPLKKVPLKLFCTNNKMKLQFIDDPESYQVIGMYMIVLQLMIRTLTGVVFAYQISEGIDKNVCYFKKSPGVQRCRKFTIRFASIL